MRHSFLPAFLSILLVANAGFARRPALESSREGPLTLKVREVDLTEFPRVNVVFDLSSKEKLDYRYLTRESLQVVEEEVPVDDFVVMPHDVLLSLGIVVDDSGSLDHDLGHVKGSVTKVVSNLRYHDRATVVSFARGNRVIVPLTADKRLLVDAVSRLKAYGVTELLEGMRRGLAEVSQGAGKRALLVLTDGNDNVPEGGEELTSRNLAELVKQARDSNVEISTIGIGDRVNHKTLTTLARLTGGVYVHAPRAFDVERVVEDIALALRGKYKLAYTSPRSVEDAKLRDVRLSARFRGHEATDTFRYRLTTRTNTASVTVRRAKTYRDGTGDLQVFTTGLRQQPLTLRFYLFDRYNRPVRQGMTSPDGYGKLDGREPELTNIPPGTYRLDLEVPGTTLRYLHAGVVVAAGRTAQVEYAYSKVMFRRNKVMWYDTPHAYGDTSELITVKISDLSSGRLCYSGRLIDFTLGRETYIWLPRGRYRIELGNVWAQANPPDVEKVILRNKLEADIASPGGNVLFFDVSDSDLVLEDDVLAHAPPPPSRRVSLGRVLVQGDDSGNATRDDRGSTRRSSRRTAAGSEPERPAGKIAARGSAGAIRQPGGATARAELGAVVVSEPDDTGRPDPSGEADLNATRSEVAQALSALAEADDGDHARAGRDRAGSPRSKVGGRRSLSGRGEVFFATEMILDHTTSARSRVRSSRTRGALSPANPEPAAMSVPDEAWAPEGPEGPDVGSGEGGDPERPPRAGKRERTAKTAAGKSATVEKAGTARETAKATAPAAATAKIELPAATRAAPKAATPTSSGGSAKVETPAADKTSKAAAASPTPRPAPVGSVATGTPRTAAGDGSSPYRRLLELATDDGPAPTRRP